MKRLVPGLIMTALWVVLLFFGPPWLFGLAIVGIAACGLAEFFRMTMATAPASVRLLGLLIAILPAAASVAAGQLARPQLLLGSLFLSLICLLLVELARFAGSDHSLRLLGDGVLAVVYISFCLAHLVLIRFLPQGEGWLLVLTAITAGGDTGAYYIGTALGRHKLCPRISPKKTVEGAVGGVAAGILCALAVGWYVLPQTGPLLLALAALLLSLAGIAGDLTESVIKRTVGVKDSGTLLFDHGGVLDRIDSLLLAGPALYYLLLLFG